MKNKNTKDKTEKKKKPATKTMKEVKVSNLLRPSLIKRILQNSFPGLFLRTHRLIRYSLGWLCAEFEGSLASMTSSTARTSYDNLQPSLHYSKSSCLQNETITSSNLISVGCLEFDENIENLSPRAHVVRTTAKLLISRRWKNEYGCEMSKLAECKARRTAFNCQNMQICGDLLVVDI